MWIEMPYSVSKMGRILVIPHVGMWIEILMQNGIINTVQVIPHVGMWIEINADAPDNRDDKSSLT